MFSCPGPASTTALLLWWAGPRPLRHNSFMSWELDELLQVQVGVSTSRELLIQQAPQFPSFEVPYTVPSNLNLQLIL
jgi:hypothetical protein